MDRRSRSVRGNENEDVQMMSRQRILFVCARNRIRSITAERMFEGSQIYDVKSRGVAKDARVRLKESDIRWAEMIFVMEKNHKDRIMKEFRSAVAGREIICLFIEDIYVPMEEALQSILKEKLVPYLHLPPDCE